MEEDQFLVMAKGDRLDMKLAITVRSTGACMEGSVTKAKNDVFDMLRKQDFNVDKIEFV